jgi:hypothetical protein
MAPMPTFEELDRLSSRELHDRAVKWARRHLDARFFWDLVQITPAAEAAAGDLPEADSDIQHWSGQVLDAMKDEDPEAVDGRRAYYIEYLSRHGD